MTGFGLPPWLGRPDVGIGLSWIAFIAVCVVIGLYAALRGHRKMPIPAAITRFPVDRDPTTEHRYGRKDVDDRIAGAKFVQAEHFAIGFSHGMPYIVGLGTEGGVWINGQQVLFDVAWMVYPTDFIHLSAQGPQVLIMPKRQQDAIRAYTPQYVPVFREGRVDLKA